MPKTDFSKNTMFMQKKFSLHADYIFPSPLSFFLLIKIQSYRKKDTSSVTHYSVVPFPRSRKNIEEKRKLFPFTIPQPLPKNHFFFPTGFIQNLLPLPLSLSSLPPHYSLHKRKPPYLSRNAESIRKKC